MLVSQHLYNFVILANSKEADFFQIRFFLFISKDTVNELINSSLLFSL